MNNLKLNDFVNYIYNDDAEKKIVYIGVGTAHHMARIEDGKRVIEDKVNQQHPLYIRDLHVKNPDHKLYIVLIDPLLENPCFTIGKKVANPPLDEFDDGWKRKDNLSNVFENEEENIMLMEFREYVSYGDDLYNYGVQYNNIEHLFNSLNQIAIVDKWFVNVMDFCGRNLYGLASYYDKDLGDDKDHIFYGLSSRIDGGCYIDLCENSVYFVSNRDKGYITAFSPYFYNRDQLSDIYKSISKKEDRDSIIMKEQMKIASQRIIDSYKKDVLTMYRRLRIYQNNLKTGVKNIEFYRMDYEYIQTKYKIHVSDMEELNKNIGDVLMRVSRVLDDEFAYVVDFFNKKELHGRYSEAKKIEDPYKMYADICRILEEIK